MEWLQLLKECEWVSEETAFALEENLLEAYLAGELYPEALTLLNKYDGFFQLHWIVLWLYYKWENTYNSCTFDFLICDVWSVLICDLWRTPTRQIRNDLLHSRPVEVSDCFWPVSSTETEPRVMFICVHFIQIPLLHLWLRFRDNLGRQASPNAAETVAVEAVFRALEFNPHVPQVCVWGCSGCSGSIQNSNK